MPREFVIPNSNEAEFIQIASKLGIKKICFIYNFEGNSEEKIQQKIDVVKNNKISIEIGFTANQKNLNRTSGLLVAKSSDRDRLFIESGKVKIIYGFEDAYKKDHMHQRASGLNQVICELAKKNNVAIGFPYSELFKDPLKSPILIGRMMQNIALCQKYKVKTVIGSFSGNPFDMRAPHDMSSLFGMLGMDGKSVKESSTDFE